MIEEPIKLPPQGVVGAADMRMVAMKKVWEEHRRENRIYCDFRTGIGVDGVKADLS